MNLLTVHHCGDVYLANGDQAGPRIRCQNCGQMLISELADPVPQRSPALRRPAAKTAAARRVAAFFSPWLTPRLAALALVMAAFGIGGIVYSLGQRAADRVVPARPASVMDLSPQAGSPWAAAESPATPAPPAADRIGTPAWRAVFEIPAVRPAGQKPDGGSADAVVAGRRPGVRVPCLKPGRCGEGSIQTKRRRGNG